VTSTYYLLIKKRERKNGKNYVYEQVTLENRSRSFMGVQQTRAIDFNNKIRSADAISPEFNMNRTNAGIGFKMKSDLNNFASPESLKSMTMPLANKSAKNSANVRSDFDGPQTEQT
jgi:hypothetical protein